MTEDIVDLQDWLDGIEADIEEAKYEIEQRKGEIEQWEADAWNIRKRIEAAKYEVEKSKMVYELIYEDLTHLGGPMGSEYTIRTSMGLFSDPNAAKGAGHNDYMLRTSGKKDRHRDFTWLEKGPGEWRTPDMGFVMYHVEARRIS